MALSMILIIIMITERKESCGEKFNFKSDGAFRQNNE